RGDGPAANEIADLVVDQLLAGQHRDHAGHLHRRGGIDALDLGMRVGAANEMGEGHAHQLDIVDVTALARDETLVFLAHHAGANAFNTHVSSPCRSLCAATSIEARRSDASDGTSSPAYSAACATFMRPAASSTALTML